MAYLRSTFRGRAMQFQPSLYSAVGAPEEGAPPASDTDKAALRKKRKEAARKRAREKREERRVILVPAAIGGGVLLIGLIGLFVSRKRSKKAPAVNAAAAPAGAAGQG